VEDEAGMTREPFQDLGMFVCGVIVDDDVDGLLARHSGVDDIEETDKLLMAMTLHALADHLAFENVEGGEQGCGAVAFVIVGHGVGAAPSSSASRAGCGRVPGFGSSHQPTARWRGPAD
jgi:hypothetical protein